MSFYERFSLLRLFIAFFNLFCSIVTESDRSNGTSEQIQNQTKIFFFCLSKLRPSTKEDKPEPKSGGWVGVGWQVFWTKPKMKLNSSHSHTSEIYGSWDSFAEHKHSLNAHTHTLANIRTHSHMHASTQTNSVSLTHTDTLTHARTYSSDDP